MWGYGGIGCGGLGFGGWGGMFFGGLTMLLLWGGLMVLGFLAVRGLLRSRQEWTSPGPALEVLRERYARGEVTREQYETMRQDLL